MQKLRAKLLASLVAITAASATAQSGEPTASASPKLEEGYVPTEDGTRLFYQKVGSGSQVGILPLRFYTFEAFRQLGDQYTVYRL